MKRILLIITLAGTALLHQACEKCEILEMTVEDPDPLFDCPDFMANVGDACDDGNPDTINDAIDANCNCTGEILNTCSGTLYAARFQAADNVGNPSAWFFDGAPKAQGQLGAFAPIGQQQNALLNGDPFPTNFAAFDPLNRNYVMAYQYGPQRANPMYYAQTAPFADRFFTQETFFSAPAFLNGRLYAMQVTLEGNNASYEIVEIDQNNGALRSLFSEKLRVNSPLLNAALSSASDHQNGLVYFLSSTNLFVFDPAAVSVTRVDIDPGYTPSEPDIYFGLELQNAPHRLLAVRGRFEPGGGIAELVSISTDGNYTVQTVFDISNNLSDDNDGEIAFASYASTFAQCDNTYYLSELVAPNTDPQESFLIEIRLDENVLSSRRLPDFVFGLEMRED